MKNRITIKFHKKKALKKLATLISGPISLDIPYTTTSGLFNEILHTPLINEAEYVFVFTLPTEEDPLISESLNRYFTINSKELIKTDNKIIGFRVTTTTRRKYIAQYIIEHYETK